MATTEHRCVLGDNEWCTPEAPCFSCEDTDHRHRHPAGDVEGCAQCHHQSVQLSPAATPNRTRRVGPLGAKGNNSWERGIARDGRGMPLLKSNGDQIGVKEYGERRHDFEAARRQLANTPAPPT